MKTLLFASILVFTILTFPTSLSAQCEGGVYTTSLSWQTTSSAHGFTSTELDYCAGLYYDPANSGSFVETFDTNSAVIGEGYTEGDSDSVPAQLSFDYFGPINNGSYTTNGNHYVIAYYQVYVPQFNDYMWYDPWNLGFEEIDNESFLAPDDYAYFGYVTYWASSPQFVGNTSETITYTGQSQCLPGQQFTPSGQPCSSLPGCESGLQFSSTGEICPNYVPPTAPPAELEVAVAFDDDTIRPRGTKGSTSTGVTACVVNLLGNVDGFGVELDTERVDWNTGHKMAHHSGTRPIGNLSRSSGLTDSQGCFRTTYFPSHISGKTKVKATILGAQGSATVSVYVESLVRLKPGANYRLNGAANVDGEINCDAPDCTESYMSEKIRQAHPSNHWVLSPARPFLVKIADDYKNQFYGNGYIPPADMITYNDASLIWGGKFDLTLDWRNLARDHEFHREGKNVDTRSSNIGNRHNAFLEIANANNFGIHDERERGAPHYHLIWDRSYNTVASNLLENGIDQSSQSFAEGPARTTSDLSFGASEVILYREITQEEFESWYSQLTNARSMGPSVFLAEVKTFYQQLFTSQEYIARQRTDQQFVRDVFESHLFREPTEQEFAYWTEHLSRIGGGEAPPEPELEIESPRIRSGSTILDPAQKRQMFLIEFENLPRFVELVGNVTDDETAEPAQ